MLRMLKLLQEFGRDVSPGLINSGEGGSSRSHPSHEKD
ncbi:hypothetical protein Lser_V15G03502 [Lactuca serriola]